MVNCSLILQIHKIMLTYHTSLAHLLTENVIEVLFFKLLCMSNKFDIVQCNLNLIDQYCSYNRGSNSDRDLDSYIRHYQVLYYNVYSVGESPRCDMVEANFDFHPDRFLYYYNWFIDCILKRRLYSFDKTWCEICQLIHKLQW